SGPAVQLGLGSLRSSEASSPAVLITGPPVLHRDVLPAWRHAGEIRDRYTGTSRSANFHFRRPAPHRAAVICPYAIPPPAVGTGRRSATRLACLNLSSRWPSR